MKFHLLQGENVYKTDYGLSNIYENCSCSEPPDALLRWRAASGEPLLRSFHNWCGVSIMSFIYSFFWRIEFQKIIYNSFPPRRWGRGREEMSGAVQGGGGCFCKEVCGFGKGENLVKKCLFASQPACFSRQRWKLEKWKPLIAIIKKAERRFGFL